MLSRLSALHVIPLSPSGPIRGRVPRSFRGTSSSRTPRGLASGLIFGLELRLITIVSRPLGRIAEYRKHPTKAPPRSMSIAARVVRLVHLTPHVVELYLEPETPITYAPGQWVSLALPVGPRPPIKRVYSMASPMRDDGLLHLIFDLVPEGLGSSYLAGLTAGSTIEIKSHMGNFVLPDPLHPKLLFVARYTGIVPVFAMLKQLEQDKFTGQIHVIYGSPDASERFFLNEIESLDLTQLTLECINLDTADCEDPEAKAALTYGQTVDLESMNAFICGVGALTRPLRKQLIELGIPKRQVRAERFN